MKFFRYIKISVVLRKLSKNVRFLPQNHVFCKKYNNNGTKKHFNYAFFTKI